MLVAVEIAYNKNQPKNPPAQKKLMKLTFETDNRNWEKQRSGRGVAQQTTEEKRKTGKDSGTHNSGWKKTVRTMRIEPVSKIITLKLKQDHPVYEENGSHRK